MATIHFTLNTTSTPEQFIAGLTDFGPGREELFGRSEDGYLKGPRPRRDRGGKSGHTYTLTTRPDGATEVDVVVVRDGTNFKGRAIGVVLALFGKRVLGGAFAKTLKAIEARNGATSVSAPRS